MALRRKATSHYLTNTDPIHLRIYAALGEVSQYIKRRTILVKYSILLFWILALLNIRNSNNYSGSCFWGWLRWLFWNCWNLLTKLSGNLMSTVTITQMQLWKNTISNFNAVKFATFPYKHSVFFIKHDCDGGMVTTLWPHWIWWNIRSHFLPHGISRWRYIQLYHGMPLANARG